MGCNCIKNEERNDLEVDAQRVKSLSMKKNNLANKIKQDKRLLACLLRCQSIFRGIITRNKLRVVKTSNRQFMGRDNSNYTYTATTKIVYYKP
jgi:hypothetical protein